MKILNRQEVEALRQRYQKGDRLRLLYTDDPDTDNKPGLLGAVDYVDDAGTIHMIWDNGSTLGLIPGVDEFERAERKEP